MADVFHHKYMEKNLVALKSFVTYYLVNKPAIASKHTAKVGGVQAIACPEVGSAWGRQGLLWLVYWQVFYP